MDRTFKQVRQNLQLGSNGIWRIEMLGGLRVRRGDRPVLDSLPRKAGALLARLAYYPNRSHAREELMEMLWPDEDPDATRLRFRQVLTTLRRELDPSGGFGETPIIADRMDVRINPKVLSTDVAEFEAEVARASKAESEAERAESLSAAIRMYHGALLPGFYDDWVGSERQRLADEFLEAMCGLSESLLSSGENQAAVELARRAAAADYVNERCACALMTALAAAGRSSEAIRQYQALEQTLWKELRTAPSESTRALADSIRSGTLQSRSAVHSRSTGTIADSLTLGAASGTLPESLTQFFGRAEELEFIISTLSSGGTGECRLITLVGPGGAGKTRLALEGAKRLSPDYPDAVWFIPLTGLTTTAQLLAAITEAICRHDNRSPNSIEQLADIFGGEAALVILDNFEQMVEECAKTVLELMETAPNLRCLVTSRTRLNVAGEQELSVAPLPIPESELDPSSLMEIPSVKLFVDRARKAKADFRLTESNAESVALLCRRLEGIPLALELAAGWSGALSPSQILDRMSHRFELLVSRRKDIEERHRSLLTTIVWSYEQLPADLQGLFVSLSVFRGGWTLESAEDICAAGKSQAAFVLDGLDQLRERSLIFSEAVEEGVRFRMLETLREFAYGHTPIEKQEELRATHARHFLALVERAGPQLTRPDQLSWHNRLEVEHGNICAALEWAASDNGDIDIGLRIVTAVWRFWDTRCHRAEAEFLWIPLKERAVHASPSNYARALVSMGSLATNYEETAAGMERLREALTIYEKVDDKEGIARALFWLGIAYRDENQIAEGKRCLEESLEIYRQLSDLDGEGNALAALAECIRRVKEYTEARALLDNAAALLRITGNQRGLAWCLLAHGFIAVLQDDMEEAISFLSESISLYRVLDDPTNIVPALFSRAYAFRALGDLESAQRDCEEALTFARRAHSLWREAALLIWLGDLAWDRSEVESASRRYLEAVKFSYERGYSFELRCALGGVARVSAHYGELDRAAQLYTTALKIDAKPEGELAHRHPKDIRTEFKTLEGKMDSERFRSSSNYGKGLSMGEAAALALSTINAGSPA